MNITAENPLGSQFQFGWNDRKGKKYKTKVELTQQKVWTLAHDLQKQHFSADHESTRKVAAELRAMLSSVEAACRAHDSDTVSLSLSHTVILDSLVEM